MPIALCWASAVLSPTSVPLIARHCGVFLSAAAGSSPTWTTRSWTTLCPESMCCICDRVGRCSSSSHTSGSSPASPVARTRHTTSSPTSPCASSSWSASLCVSMLNILAVFLNYRYTFDDLPFRRLFFLSVPTGKSKP